MIGKLVYLSVFLSCVAMGPFAYAASGSAEVQDSSLAVADAGSDLEATQSRSALQRLVQSARTNSRFSWDVASRPLYYSDTAKWGTQHAIGVDYFKVFSTASRDIGTLVAQAYYTRIDGVRGHPGFFDDNHDGELVYRIFNFNFTGLGGKLPNVRIGHMEVPYGLEQVIDTNGTLRQYAQPQNLGLKADWGVSLNKQHRRFEYEVAATTGGIQDLERQQGSFVFSARVGSNRDANTVVGGSVYRSLLAGMIRERVGIDVQHYFGRNGLLAEVSTGTNADDDVRNALVELNRSNRRNSFSYYTQFSYFSTQVADDWQRTLNGAVGIKFTPDSKLSFSAQLSRALKTPNDEHPTTVSVQARYRI